MQLNILNLRQKLILNTSNFFYNILLQINFMYDIIKMTFIPFNISKNSNLKVKNEKKLVENK